MAPFHTEVDPLLEALGGRGRYQLMQYFVSKIFAFSASFQLFNIVYIGRNIPHVCNKPDNISDIFTLIDDDVFNINTSNIFYDKCNIRVETNVTGDLRTKELPCLYGYSFTERQELSIISDMEIVCDKAPMRGLGQTMMIGGQGIGAFLLPIFSDRFGRRPVHLISHLGILAFGIGVAFSPNYTVFLILRLLIGTFQQGIVLTDSTIGIETFSTRYRKTVAFLTNIGWCVCSMFLPLVAYLLRDHSWRMLQLGCCSVSIVIIIQFFCLDESLQWLVANKRTSQIRKVLKRAARISNVDYNHLIEVYHNLKTRQHTGGKDTSSKSNSISLHDQRTSDEKPLGSNRLACVRVKRQEAKVDDDKDHSHSLLDYMKHKRLALNVAVLWFLWFTDSMTYFGLYLTSDTLAGDRFVNVVLLTFVQMPSSVFVYVCLDRFGRKKTCMAQHAISAFGLIGATVSRSVIGHAKTASIVATVFACFGFFGMFGAFVATLFFYTPEIFPTNMRNVGLGTSSSFSRIGGMLAPFAGLLAEYKPWAPGAVLSSFCIVATLSVHILPETRGRELPQTLSDVKAWYQKPDDDETTQQDLEVCELDNVQIMSDGSGSGQRLRLFNDT